MFCPRVTHRNGMQMNDPWITTRNRHEVDRGLTRETQEENRRGAERQRGRARAGR